MAIDGSSAYSFFLALFFLTEMLTQRCSSFKTDTYSSFSVFQRKNSTFVGTCSSATDRQCPCQQHNFHCQIHLDATSFFVQRKAWNCCYMLYMCVIEDVLDKEKRNNIAVASTKKQQEYRTGIL
jgi:hypothetical protein